MDLSGITVDFAPILGFGVVIVTALVTLIPLRKAIKTANRS